MRYAIKILLLLAAVHFMGTSCSNEFVDSEETGVPTSITFETRGALFPEDLDNTITSLRIMAFTQAGILRSNKLYELSELSQNITLNINSGTYRFVFVANEPSTLTSTLQSVKNYSAMATINVGSDKINSTDVIPMSYNKADVTVTPDEKVIIDGTTYSTWLVPLERIAVRVDMVVKSYVDYGPYFEGIVFYNMPNSVPLLADYATAGVVRMHYDPVVKLQKPEHYETLTASELGSYAWGIKFKRYIMPSNMFSPVSQRVNVVNMTLTFGGGIASKGALLCVNEAGNDFTLPRNSHITISGVVEPNSLNVNLEAEAWTPNHVDVDLGVHILNVTNVAPVASAVNPTKVHFYSNQKSVFVEPLGFVGESGNVTFNVNDVFDEITGPFNFDYSSVTGEGHIDIIPLTMGAAKYRIFLNAGGLRRQLLVTVV